MDTASAIIVRLELQIPVSGGAAPPILLGSGGIVQPGTQAPPAPVAAPAGVSPVARAMLAPRAAPTLPAGFKILNFDFPGQVAKVKAATGGTSGVICASGRALLAPPYNKRPKVTVRIYTDIFQNVPNEPEGGVELGETDSQGFWGIAELGTANCGATASDDVKNRFVVWYDYENVIPTAKEDAVFIGVRADTTDDCDVRLRTPPPAMAGIPTVIVPQWSLHASGFAGDRVADLNGQWSLSINTAEKRPFLWTSSSGSARVELYLTVPCASKWKLVFVNRGVRIEYSMPAAEWSSTGANIFTTVHSEGLPPDAAIPASLVVLPG